jgi:hypothetical protein
MKLLLKSRYNKMLLLLYDIILIQVATRYGI